MDRRTDKSACEAEFKPETWTERMWGLTDALPQSTVKKMCSAGNQTKKHIKVAAYYLRNCGWIVGSTAAILFLPLYLQLELQKC